MNAVNITKTIYVAWDGTEFDNANQCEVYEKANKPKPQFNCRNFEISFPMQDEITTCRAYLISSENMFNSFKEYLLDKYSSFEPYHIEYEGNGWYVVQDDDTGEYADVIKLSTIISDWSKTLDTIAKRAIDLEGV